MADLPTNYLDDILAQSMNGKRKYRLSRADGTFEEVTIEDISEYAQIGSTFGAGDINKTNQAVNEKFDSGDVVDPMLTTEPGFAADAYQTKLQFDEQNKNLTWKTLGSVTSNNVINLPESFSEIKADVLGNNYSYSFNFILEQLNPSSERSYIDGYCALNSNGQAVSSYCILNISRTKAYIMAYMEDSAQPIPTLTIFYR